MKHLKRFNESSDFEYDTWEEIISSMDVYQLYELLQFKYGEVLTDTKQAEWTQHRTDLLNLPDQSGFPNTVSWPTKPT